MTADVEQVARSLSAATRDALVAGRWANQPFAEELVRHALAKRERGYILALTPLGISVREYLLEHPND